MAKNVGFGTVSDTFLTEAVYRTSFGELWHETPYYDPWRGIDRRKELGVQIEKALNISSNSALIPVYVDPDIINLTRRNTPFLELLPRVTNRGKTADYNKITAIGSATWEAEDATLTEQDITTVRASTNIAFGYAVGRVTGPMVAASREYVDAMNLAIQNATLRLRLLEETTALRGSTNAGDDTDIYAVDTDGYDGLIKLITTNTTNAAGGTITISMLRDSIRSAIENNGNPNLIVTDYKTFNDLKSLLQDYVRYIDINTEIQFGIKGIEFDGIPVLPSRSMPNVANKRHLLVLDMSVIEMRVLQDLMYEDLAKTNDSRKFMVKVYEALVLKAEQFCAKIYNLA